ncbi:MAG: SDR family NAD(P)-dependent oxidoreductase, partial [Hyphomonas sp.]
MTTTLITGANRGIGLELVRKFLAQGHDVIATARDPETSNELNATGAKVYPLE